MLKKDFTAVLKLNAILSDNGEQFLKQLVIWLPEKVSSFTSSSDNYSPSICLQGNAHLFVPYLCQKACKAVANVIVSKHYM